MAYYLGRDVKVYISNESNAATAIYVGNTTLKVDNGDAGSSTLFAKSRSDSMHAASQVTDLTAVDLGIGAVDEDVSFIGLNTALKAEVKKETTLSLTRKKLDAVWDVIYNGDGTNTLRWGCSGDIAADSTTNVYTGLEKPTINYGYRIHIQLKASGEIFCLRNCTISAHGTSLSADGITEETLEFTSHVDPKIVTSAYNTGTYATEI